MSGLVSAAILVPEDNTLKWIKDPSTLEKHQDCPFYSYSSNIFRKDRTNNDLEWIPFQWNAGGFIIRREGNKIVNYAIDGKAVFNTWDARLVSPHYGKFVANKYVVYCGRNGTSFKLVGFRTPLMALCYAWQSPSLKHVGFHQWRCDFKLGEDRVYKLLAPVVDLLEDREYNQITGCTLEPKGNFPQLKVSQTFPDAVCDDILYNEFSKIMDRSLAQPGHTDCRWGSKSNSVGSLECLPGEEFFAFTSKRNIPFDYVSRCVDTNGFAPIVTRFPKSGNVTSSGETRSIYPMNILYENVLRRFFGDRKPIVDHEIVSGRDFGAPMKNIYDIKGCDRICLPVFSRYCKERNLMWLIPKVVDPIYHGLKTSFYADQFPSGVYHTSFVTVCFVSALLKSLGINKAKIQGDGFMCDTEVNLEFVRKCCDFNGFVYDGSIGRWRYNRTHRINEFKYIRGGGPRGRMRYEITRWAYEKLDGILPDRTTPKCSAKITDGEYICAGCKELVMNKLHFNEFSDYAKCYTIGRMYSDVGSIVKTAMEETGWRGDMRKNNWDCFPLKETSHRAGVKEGLLFVRVESPFISRYGLAQP